MNKIEQTIKFILKSRVKTQADLDVAKRMASKKLKTGLIPNSNLLKAYHNLVLKESLKPQKNIEYLLRKRKVRSLSGIINVSVLTKPYPCPGKCIFCPSQKTTPKSYLEKEPAVQRAISKNFSPYLQTMARLKSLKIIGHPTDKIELRIIGGTWSFYPPKYQYWFIKECFRAANEFEFKNSNSSRQQEGLQQAMKENENSKSRIIGLTIETRPDYITEKEIKRLRELGVTRVELGVQNIFDDVLKINRRGHDVASIAKASKLLKDAGFKLSFQMMPNLPGSNFKKDTLSFQEIFSNPNFMPDSLKIYPLAVIKNSFLEKNAKKYNLKIYNNKKLTDLIVEIKKLVPRWCRIQRIIRDIPSEYVSEGGVKTSNLREEVQREMSKQGISCQCIRCREIKGDYNNKEKIFLFRENYESSGGKEIFLTFENKERSKLYSLLRLRIPANPIFPVLKDSAIIREIHTYGQLQPISGKESSPQHKGLGKKLIKEAERISKKEFGLKKIAVISGIGVRGYYRKLGYSLRQTYMAKSLSSPRMRGSRK
jgi:elongator complex protein 3